ncbi:MAG TPA: restriction endonuclease subunit S, partial [Victivallales bacterium]|nr:restriction endonuclease subunit S [Victivallales bacterium]
KDFQYFKIPLPPLEIQREIVAVIESYQKLIDGCRQVVDSWKPQIDIDPEWPLLTFENAPLEIIDGDRGSNYPTKEDFSSSGHCLFLNTKNVRNNGFKFDELEFITVEKDNALRKGKLSRGDVLLTTRGTVGNTAFYDDSVQFEHVRINSGMLIFRPHKSILSGSYLFLFFQSENFKKQKDLIISGAAQPQLPIRSINQIKIPLPPLEIQQEIVAKIESERKVIDGCQDLFKAYEYKIKSVIDKVWEA